MITKTKLKQELKVLMEKCHKKWLDIENVSIYELLAIEIINNYYILEKPKNAKK